MRHLKATVSLLAMSGLLLSASIAQADTDGKKKDDKDKKDYTPTHVQMGTIDVCKDDKALGLNAFCLDSSGNILCAVGKSVQVYGRQKGSENVKQGIRVFNPEGEMTAFWALDFSPQAIGFGEDNHIYVGGEGKIARLNRNGKIVSQSDAPNMQNREEMIAKLKKEHKARAKSLARSYNQMIERTQTRLDEQNEIIAAIKESPEALAKQLEKSAEAQVKTLRTQLKNYQSYKTRYEGMLEKANDASKKAYENAIDNYDRLIVNLEKRIKARLANAKISPDDPEFEKIAKTEKRKAENMVKSLERTIKTYKQYIENNANAEMTDIQIENMLKQKSKVSSISTTGKHVFVVCQATEGYGFDVWKTNAKFEKPEKVVKGLRGCCGQMDVQACENGLFVAENTGHRVAHYSLEGKSLGTFGKRDAKGEEGFGSCCNPMNVCFAKGKTVLTAESGTGRIMQFNQKGEKLAVIGNGKITGGCKNVAVHATYDLSTVYMLDLTGKKICILKPKADEPSGESKDEK